MSSHLGTWPKTNSHDLPNSEAQQPFTLILQNHKKLEKTLIRKESILAVAPLLPATATLDGLHI